MIIGWRWHEEGEEGGDSSTNLQAKSSQEYSEWNPFSGVFVKSLCCETPSGDLKVSETAPRGSTNHFHPFVVFVNLFLCNKWLCNANTARRGLSLAKIGNYKGIATCVGCLKYNTKEGRTVIYFFYSPPKEKNVSSRLLLHKAVKLQSQLRGSVCKAADVLLKDTSAELTSNQRNSDRKKQLALLECLWARRTPAVVSLPAPSELTGAK